MYYNIPIMIEENCRGCQKSLYRIFGTEFRIAHHLYGDYGATQKPCQ